MPFLDMMKKEELVELGFCRKPHGVKGAFAFSLHNSQDSILKKGLKLWLKPLSDSSELSKDGQQVTIKSISFGNRVICFLEEVPDRNTVESWIPFSFFVERGAFPKEKDGEVYLSDLIGCQVFNEQGKQLGEVSSIGTNGVQDILQVDSEEGGFDVLLIDKFVLDIDVENKKVIINEPEYL